MSGLLKGVSEGERKGRAPGTRPATPELRFLASHHSFSMCMSKANAWILHSLHHL